MLTNFENILKPIITSENISNPKIDILGSNEKGDGYLGIVTAAEVKGDNNKSLKLIIKTAPTSQKLREQTPIREAFLSEINFYDEIYPLYRKFQLENDDVRPFIKIAKCYGTVSTEYEEALIFENLKVSDFKLYDRQTTMDKNHVILVLEEYGKFHAMTYFMKEKEQAVFEKLKGKLGDTLLKMFYSDEFNGLIKSTFAKVQNIPALKRNIKISSALQQYHSNYLSFFEQCKSSEADQYAVISHGDCWCNNMLFKYEDHKNPKAPTSMRLIDWQLQKLGSPILDLSYFIYACADKNIFDELDFYLHVYHNAMTTQLRRLNCNERYLSFDTLKHQWKKFGKFGLLLAFIVIKLMLSDKDEVPDLSEAAESNKTLTDAFTFESRYEKKYQERIIDLVLHAYKIGIL